MRNLSLMLALVPFLLFHPGPAGAGTIDPPAALWNQGPAPFIALFTCKNQLETHFPNISERIENELIQAAEEWFIGNGAHVRFYYFGPLTASDPACADVPTVILPRAVGTPPAGPQPPRWSVVLTAAPQMTTQLAVPNSDRCLFAVTDRWEIPGPTLTIPPTPAIERARITLVKGQACSGAVQPWPWPDPLGPMPQTLSPARVLMKMLGHAMGLGEERGGTDTVMARIDPNVIDYRLHVSDPVVRAMRAAYGHAQSSPYWAETKDEGKTWKVLTGTPRSNSHDSLGLAGCQARSALGKSAPLYLIAETVLDANGTSTVITYSVDAQRHSARNQRSHGPSNRKPTLICGSGYFVLGMVDRSGSVRIRRSNDGLRWIDASLPAGWNSDHAPALAEAKWVDGILAATSSDQDGLHFHFSGDAGATFSAASSAQRSIFGSHFPFGLACPAATHRCYLGFGDFGFVLMNTEIQNGSTTGGGYSGGGEIPNLGTALAATKNEQGYFLARRYKPGSKFYATPNTALDEMAGGLQANAGIVAWQFASQPFSRLVSDSPIGLFRDDLHGSFTVLSTSNRVYNGYLFVVAPGP